MVPRESLPVLGDWHPRKSRTGPVAIQGKMIAGHKRTVRDDPGKVLDLGEGKRSIPIINPVGRRTTSDNRNVAAEDRAR